MAVSLLLNGKHITLDVEPDLPLLWAIREAAGLTGTKYGCGMALCGACTVHLDGKAIRSCVAPVSRVEGKRVTTIEGLSANLTHPLQQAGRRWMVYRASVSKLVVVEHPVVISGKHLVGASHEAVVCQTP